MPPRSERGDRERRQPATVPSSHPNLLFDPIFLNLFAPQVTTGGPYGACIDIGYFLRTVGPVCDLGESLFSKAARASRKNKLAYAGRNFRCRQKLITLWP
jgi:hypothetical protein